MIDRFHRLHVNAKLAQGGSCAPESAYRGHGRGGLTYCDHSEGNGICTGRWTARHPEDSSSPHVVAKSTIERGHSRGIRFEPSDRV